MVDYLRVSFKTHDVDSILENVVHLKRDFMQEKETGFYGYVGTVQLDYIKVFYSTPGDSRGVLVEMSGKGCRQFESFLRARNKTWYDFFQDCIAHNGSFTRFDLALDDTKTYFSVPFLLEKIKRAELITRFKRMDYNGSFDIGEEKEGGTTLYFGSKKSDAYLCFYEKNYEQARKYERDVEEFGEWNRYEIRLKDDRAQVAIEILIEEQDLRYVALSIVNNYIRFVDRRDDVSKEYYETSAFWQDFIGDASKLRLYQKPEEDFYEKSRNWLKNSCAPTMKMILESDQVLGNQDLSDMIVEAELSDKQEKMLAVFLADVGDMVC
ncbi:replication initiation factor domain-containing protein [Virgibacillus salidurans]|uniref:replication initiation factor domain-containing protein n=1 Tax=Virgibacillus salidurans TaxID=2831673 RepID=UPI001F30EDA5|nr:replication initiation factor domain-containing protein [Virgibacillus sp. NKC19-16]